MTHDLNGTLSAVRQTLCGLATSVVMVVAPGLTSAQTLDVAARHDDLTTQLEVMPESGLKTLYIGCSREAMQRALGSGEAASCSIVYETLLRRSFSGDFMALLAWSRTPWDDAIAEGLKETMPARNVEALQR
jgi:hypothetical protein